MKRTILIGAAIAWAIYAAPTGMRPRADASSYPSHQKRGESSVGAALIPRDQAKKMFQADLNKAGYVVVEVGVFPAPGGVVDLYPTDFTLFVGEGSVALRPVESGSIAGNIVHPDRSPVPGTSGDVQLSSSVGIGHVSYDDPVTGQRRGSTITSVGSAVAIGAPDPTYPRGGQSRTQTAREIEQELWEKSLPDGKISQPVAGYLYFPKPSGKAKDAVWELRFENADGRTRLPLSH